MIYVYCTSIFDIFLLQLQIIARDGGVPAKQSTRANVELKVGRNKFGPEFTEKNLRFETRENLELGKRIINVKAEDKDKEVIYYQILLSLSKFY